MFFTLNRGRRFASSAYFMFPKYPDERRGVLPARPPLAHLSGVLPAPMSSALYPLLPWDLALKALPVVSVAVRVPDTPWQDRLAFRPSDLTARLHSRRHRTDP
ncbi:unnamed protein product [Arctogadus glacialis]